MSLKLKPLVFSFLILVVSLFLSLNSFGQNTQLQNENIIQHFIPDYAKLQFAGGIGFVSTGIGYAFFKHKLDVTFFYGYVPKAFSIDDLHSISLQFTAKPFRIKLTETIAFLPFNVGWFVHHTFGNEFWVTLPDNYPEDYYWWSPGRNAGVFVGTELKTSLMANATPALGLAFYFRVGTRGLYLASKAQNSSIPFSEIIEYGFGIALYR